MPASRELKPKTSHLKPSEVRVRIAPSPTGPFHIGTARTALFNWLFARQSGGKFILRVEDTDKERSGIKWEKEIMDGLTWLGLTWDEFYRQSERTEIYKKYLEKLLADSHAYYCCCTKEDLEGERQAMISQGLPAKYQGHCRNLAKPPPGKAPQVIRFKTQEAKVEFKDVIRGTVKFDAGLFGDMVIAKDLNMPLYNFAAVVDDEEMKITHVIRGEDHLSNTPKQILLQKALGFREPEYAHMPLILAADRSKLSKRYAESSFSEYIEKGYLPEALVNFLALLGWHSKEDKEVFTKEELIKEFDLKRVQKAGAVFNPEKLDWLQKEHLKLLSVDEITNRLEPLLKEKGIKIAKAFLGKIAEVEKRRIKTLKEFPDSAGFFFKLPDYKMELLMRQNETKEKTKKVLEETLATVEKIKEENFNRDGLAPALADIISREGRGAVLWPLRVAVSGLGASPDPLEIIDVLGKRESERRIKIAIERIKSEK